MQLNLMSNLRMQLQQQNMTYEQFIEQQGGEQQFNMMMMMQTREMLVQGYALDALFRHEKMVLTDEDIEAACRSMSPQQNPKQVRNQMEQTGRGFALREAAERLKANRWLVGPRHRERGGPSGGPDGSGSRSGACGRGRREGRLGPRRRGRGERGLDATPPCGEIACEAARLMRAASAFPDF